MSKYKKGDKFICEIKEVINCERATLYRSNFNTLVFDDYGLDRLPKYVEPDNKEGYRKGCADTWGMVREIDSMPNSEKIKIFGYADLLSILGIYDPEEAYEKLKMYEDEKKIIKYGDEVRHNQSGYIGVITDIDSLSGNCCILWNHKGYGVHDKKLLTKTGRNFADKLSALLNEIGGSDGKEETDS